MKTRSICKRCHRLRVVNDRRYCVACADTLDDLGKSRPRKTDNTTLGVAPTDPAPKPESEKP